MEWTFRGGSGRWTMIILTNELAREKWFFSVSFVIFLSSKRFVASFACSLSASNRRTLTTQDRTISLLQVSCHTSPRRWCMSEATCFHLSHWALEPPQRLSHSKWTNRIAVCGTHESEGAEGTSLFNFTSNDEMI